MANAKAGILDDADLGKGTAKRDRKPSPYDEVVGQLTALFRENTVKSGRIISASAEAQVKDMNELRRAGNFHGVKLKTRKQASNPLETRFRVESVK